MDSAEQVMSTCSDELGDVVAAIPDGELGARLNWVFYLAARAYREHPDLQIVQDNQGQDIRQPRPDAPLEERARSFITFKLRDGIADLRFDSLHYAEPAIESYAVFRRLREDGRLAPDARFQVALPSAGSAVAPFFCEHEHWDAISDAYIDAARREIVKMLQIIPVDDLVIQFDIAVEVRDLYLGDDRSIPWAPARSLGDKWAWHLRQIEPLADVVPAEVALGYHLCFGTWGGWPHTPGVKDLGVCVRLVNEITRRANRAVDYIHLPVLPGADAAFMAPLASVSANDTHLYLGLVYHDGVTGARNRIALAREHLQDFGVAWYCGFGRLDPDEVLPILRHIHAGAQELIDTGSA
jgi:hypothetical protein